MQGEGRESSLWETRQESGWGGAEGTGQGCEGIAEGLRVVCMQVTAHARCRDWDGEYLVTLEGRGAGAEWLVVADRDPQNSWARDLYGSDQ